MEKAHKTGVAFGLTSGVITTLGSIIGLWASTSSKLAVIAGIIIIAISDSFSDAFGIHISEETRGASHSKVWSSTFAAFISKLLIALTFLIPILTLPLQAAILSCLAWGLLLTILFNYHLAVSQKKSPHKIITEHVGLAILVIAITYMIGRLVAIYF